MCPHRNPIVETKPYHIRPSDIKLKDNGCTATLSFGKHEAEETAGKLVRFFQQKGYWAEFTPEELMAYQKANGLWSDGWSDLQLLYGLAMADRCKKTNVIRWRKSSVISVRPKGKLAITEEFILRCAGLHNPRRS